MTNRLLPSLDDDDYTFVDFRANQVLRDNDLNQTINYLRKHGRYSNLHQLGAGIIDGFEPVWEGATRELTITRGLGLTSQGYLLALPSEFQYANIKYSHAREVELPLALRASATSDDSIPSVLELRTEGSDEEQLQDEHEELIVVLLMESETVTHDPYPEDELDARYRSFPVKAFLLEESIATEILLRNFGVDGGNLARLEELLLRVPPGDPFIDQMSGFETMSSLADWNARWLEVRRRGTEQLNTVLGSIAASVSSVWTRFQPGGLPRIEFDDANVSQVPYDVEHLRHVVRAYQEYAEEAFELVDVPRPDPYWFPTHLFLGSAANNNEPTVFRTPYLQPANFNGNANRRQRVELLFNRLHGLLKHYQDGLSITQPIRVTPSKSGDAKLGERAIPYYYAADLVEEATLQKVWNPGQSRRRTSARVYSYHQQSASSETPYSRPLKYDLSDRDFYRVEGHLGKSLSDVKTELSALRPPFDVVFVALGDGGDGDRQPLHRFAQQHPSLRPLSGVRHGGTLVLVSAGDVVVGDLCLSYRVAQKIELPKPPMIEVAGGRTAFFSDDGDEHPITVDPDRGGVLTGLGVVGRNFIAKDARVREGSITITYTDDETTSSLQLNLFPKPQFAIDAPSPLLIDPASKVKLEGNPAGGRFKASVTGTDVIVKDRDLDGEFFFNPKAANVVPGERITLSYEVPYEGDVSRSVRKTIVVASVNDPPVAPDPVLPDPIDPLPPPGPIPDPVLPDPIVPGPVGPGPVGPDPVALDPPLPDPPGPDIDPEEE